MPDVGDQRRPGSLDERAALRLLAEELPTAGDDAAVVDGLVLTTDMLHESTDFPPGTTRYTAGWRAVGASLSDVAAMGASARAAVAVYAAPAFDPTSLREFVTGARDVCDRVDAEYVGGDLDAHQEFTVATTAIGEADDPIRRRGANPGEVVCVTGTLGRSAAAVRLFEQGAADRANELFRFEPRVAAGRALARHASSMMDSSDGLARSLHQLAEASGCGFAIDSDDLPFDASLEAVTSDRGELTELGLGFGEDFELVATLPADRFEAAAEASPTPVTEIGTVTEGGVELDGRPLADDGYTHGGS